MRRVIISIHLKRIFLLIFIGVAFIIILSVFMVGVGQNNVGVIKSIPKFFMKSNSVIFNEKNQINPKIKVYITKENKVKEMGLEDYVVGVVASEVPAEFSKEALKAQAVAARTFALAHMESFGGHKYKSNTGADVCDTVQCQVFMNKEDRFKSWEENKREEYWNKITSSVQETSGEFLTYDNKLVMEPYYFAVSSGKTEDASEVFQDNVPYLKSVSSFGEERAPKYKSKITISYNNFIKKINSNYKDCELSLNDLKNGIQIKDRSKGGAVKEIKIGKVTLSGVQFRKIIGLNSANFNIEINDNNININCSGYGHGVGMSQWGANSMAKSGKSYKEIVKHYYSGVEVNKIGKY